MHEAFADRRVRLAGVLLSAAALGYFHVLDRVLFSSAHFSPIFRRLLTAYDSQTAWLALAVCCLAALWSRPAPVLMVVEFFANHPHCIALAGATLIALGAVVAYHGYPLSMDEYAALFQAKIFASGDLYAQLPPGHVDWLVVRGFNGSFLVASTETGRAIEHYWPGFALLLAPFELLNAPWLCNASLAGVALYLIYWITKEITGDRRAAGWAMLFTIASGAFVANALSYYSMQAHLTANLLFAALLLKPTRGRALGAGLTGSLALILHNPVPHALFAIPWIAAMAMTPEQRRCFLPLVLGYLPGVAIGLAWLMFRADVGSGSYGVSSAVQGVADGIFAWPNAALMNMRAAALIKMWIWAVPCLFVLALLGRLRHSGNRYARLLTHSAVLTFIGYLFVRFDQGHGWGYRYFQSAWGAVPILAGCAMTDRSGAERGLVSFAGALTILNLIVVMPFQLHQVSDIISQHLAQLPAPKRPGNNVYFIHPRAGSYVADMVQIDPLLRDPDLLLVSRGAVLDAQLIRENWPDAIEVASGGAADQWYLGPADRRLPIPGSKSQRQFVMSPRAPAATPPNAAGH